MALPKGYHANSRLQNPMDNVDHVLCETTINYNVLVNGKLKRKITPTRGLRQGDPLLPYLFIMCIEELSSMLNRVEQQGKIQRAIIMRGGTSINHFLFTDDCILYSRATKDDWENIQAILTLYKKGSS